MDYKNNELLSPTLILFGVYYRLWLLLSRVFPTGLTRPNVPDPTAADEFGEIDAIRRGGAELLFGQRGIPVATAPPGGIVEEDDVEFDVRRCRAGEQGGIGQENRNQAVEGDARVDRCADAARGHAVVGLRSERRRRRADVVVRRIVPSHKTLRRIRGCNILSDVLHIVRCRESQTSSKHALDRRRRSVVDPRIHIRAEAGREGVHGTDGGIGSANAAQFIPQSKRAVLLPYVLPSSSSRRLSAASSPVSAPSVPFRHVRSIRIGPGRRSQSTTRRVSSSRRRSSSPTSVSLSAARDADQWRVPAVAI